MTRALMILAVLGASGVVHAQEKSPPGPTGKRDDGKARPKVVEATPVTKGELAELWDQREVLRRAEIAAMAHAERERDPAKVKATTTRLVSQVIERRDGLAALVERRMPKKGDKQRPRALELVAELDMDQYSSSARLAGINGGDVDSDTVRRYKDLSVRWLEELVDEAPDFPGLGNVLDTISQHYFDTGNHDKAKLALQRMLCANRDAELIQLAANQDKADNIYQQKVYAQSVALESYQGCKPRIRDRELIDDGWMRLGWLHRAGSGELALAVSAYEQAADDPRSPSYFVALQELAATYYESGQLIDAIPPLDLLVEYLDGLAANKPDEYDDTLREVRAEAVTRAADILAELWRESALPKADASLELANIYFRGRTQGHVRDVFEELGAALRGLGAFEQARAVWSHMLTRWPEHPRAPIVHDKLVKLLIETGNPSAADAQREKLIARFDGKTRWRAANKRDRPALARADEIVAETLHALSTSAFRLAQKRFQAAVAAGKGEASDAELYDRAARFAARVVDRFPDSARGYDAAFQLAHLEFFRGNKLLAAKRFRWVRDRDPVGKYAIDATKYMVEAYEEALEDAVTDKSLVLPAIPDAAALKSAKPVTLPAMVAEVRRAYDDYADDVSSPLLAATALYHAAELSLRYQHVAEAEKRYRAVVREYCQTSRAHEAAVRLQLITTARGGQTVAQRAEDLLNKACGANAPVQLVRKARVKKFLVDARRLVAAGRQLEAGRSFYQAHRNSAPGDASYAEALVSAGEAFAAAGRAEVAAKVLAPFATDPALGKNPVAARARWRIAEVDEQLFDYERAVDAYLALRSHTAAAEPGFDLPAKKLEALWRAAELREIDRVYYDRGADDPGAASLFLAYAKQVDRDPQRASEAYLRAVQVYQRAGDARRLEQTFDAWKKRFGRDRSVAQHAVHFHYAIAATKLAAGDRRAAASAYLDVVDAYRALGGKRHEVEAELAAEAQFWRAEDRFQREIKAHVFEWPDDGDKTKSSQRIEALGLALNKAERELKAVVAYDNDWAIAAEVRLGDAYLEVWSKVIDAPVPKSLVEKFKGEGIETLELFSDQIRAALKPVIDEAGQHWVKALDNARKRGVSNAWTRLAQQRLNTHIDPGRYPVQRAEVVVVEDSP